MNTVCSRAGTTAAGQAFQVRREDGSGMPRACLVALVACCALAVANAGVTIHKSKEGDGVNFPTVGKSIKVRASRCPARPLPPKRSGELRESASRGTGAHTGWGRAGHAHSAPPQLGYLYARKDGAHADRRCAEAESAGRRAVDPWSLPHHRCTTLGSCWRQEPSSTRQRSGARRLFSPLVSGSVLCSMPAGTSPCSARLCIIVSPSRASAVWT